MSPKPLTIVIVGGVAGGASAATRARRMNERAEIILLEKDENVSFANCGLPYYIGGEIVDRNKLLVAQADLLARRFRIDVRTRHEVEAIDRGGRAVTVRNRADGQTYRLTYDKLILAPGAAPLRPPLASGDVENVFTLRNMADADHMKAAMDKCTSKRAVVVGSGFIGLEMVEQLVRQGFEAAVSELQAQILPLLDPEIAHPLDDALRRHGVAVYTADGIQRVVTDERNALTGIELQSGRIIPADLAILGLGVRPEVALARQAGLTIGGDGGIGVNEYQQTSDPDIYAVGDACEYVCGPIGRRQRVALAGPANRAGRLAGEHAATGRSQPMASVLGTSIVRVFDRTAGVTGLTAKSAARLGVPVHNVTIVANHHAGYYPGAAMLTLKLTFAPGTGRVLGAQAVGGEGIDKRLDVIATAMAFGATVRDLGGLDLAYAPPFGSAKDPIHLAAFAAGNLLDGSEQFLDADADLAGLQVVDVRKQDEVAETPLAGAPHAINIPIDELRERLGELDPSAETVVSCGVGVRAHVAARILKQHGFAQVKNLSGGVTIRNRLVH